MANVRSYHFVLASQVTEILYRAEGEKVFEYEKISGSVTVLRTDETFGFAYFDHHPGFTAFAAATMRQFIKRK